MNRFFQFKGQRKRSTLLFALAAILAVFVGFQIQRQLQGGDQVNVLVVTHALTEFTPLAASDVEIHRLPRSAVPEDAIKSKEEAIGKYTAMGILPGSPLRKGHLLPVDSWAGMMLYSGQGGKVAMPLPLESSDSAFVQAGDEVVISGFIRQGTEQSWVVVEAPVLAKRDDVMLVAIPPEKVRDVDAIRSSGAKVRIALLPKAVKS
ncbi:SAF domain-containing protein [Effusibacillus consociatus]|uniref:SAF domain-containing protein n=1 Tax=Effusibacillus consociatus TaxID=1117041 RepID=A0ABV9Q3E9_9BACL